MYVNKDPIKRDLVLNLSRILTEDHYLESVGCIKHIFPDKSWVMKGINKKV